MMNIAPAIPENFSLAKYRFTLEAKDLLKLPPHKGSALRGGFGHTFKRLACTHTNPVDDHCPAGNDCPYGYVFETTPPADSEVLRNFSEVPRPFVIESTTDRRTRIQPGQRLTFGLTLIGNGAKYLPYFIAVFRAMGEIGLGRSQGRYRLSTVDALHPKGLSEPVYRANREGLWSVTSTIDQQNLQHRAETLPTDQISLNFITPTRLKSRGKLLQTPPPFSILVRSLLGRVSSLSYFHCDERFETNFRMLIDQAAEIEIVRSRIEWDDWSRFSGRQQKKIKMGGLVGTVTYQGDIAPYLPLLALGEYIHVGKGTVFGNGQYKIET